ncbi:uncharacterized protein [Anabrus simplex]|uniref:uncharacterized protein n=1 Tax=Anabrus simplex TaxID=316456 RepID=UPI0034DDBEDB
MVTVERSCCGCSLKTGSVLIGILQLIWSASLFSSSIIIASIPEEPKLTRYSRNFTQEEQQIIRYYVHIFSKISIATVLIQGLQFILSIMMMYGAKNENARQVKPWIVYSILSLIATSAIYITLFTLAFIHKFLAIGILLLIVAAVTLAANSYFIIVVHSFHRQLLSRKRHSSRL